MRIQDLTLGLVPVSPDRRAANSEKEATMTKQANDFRGRIFSREDIFACTVYSRKYLLAKIFKIHFSRNFPPAKIKCYTVFARFAANGWNEITLFSA